MNHHDQNDYKKEKYSWKENLGTLIQTSCCESWNLKRERKKIYLVIFFLSENQTKDYAIPLQSYEVPVQNQNKEIYEIKMLRHSGM